MSEGFGPPKRYARGRRLPTAVSGEVPQRRTQVCADCETARPIGETRKRGNQCPECGGDLVPSRVYDCPRCGSTLLEADWMEHREECEA